MALAYPAPFASPTSHNGPDPLQPLPTLHHNAFGLGSIGPCRYTTSNVLHLSPPSSPIRDVMVQSTSFQRLNIRPGIAAALSHARQHAMEFRHAMRWSSAGSYAASLAFSYIHPCSSTTTTTTLPHILLFLSLSNWSRALRGDLLAATFRHAAVWVRR